MGYHICPPLTYQIMKELIPSQFKLPQLDPYDETTYQLNHLESYRALMQIQGTINSPLCIAFPTTLHKMPQAWYSQLELRSIDSFKHLEG